MVRHSNPPSTPPLTEAEVGEISLRHKQFLAAIAFEGLRPEEAYRKHVAQSDGTSPWTVKNNANRLLKPDSLTGRYYRYLVELSIIDAREEHRASCRRVRHEIERIAFARASDTLTVKNGLVDIVDFDQISEEGLAPIAGISYSSNTTEDEKGGVRSQHSVKVSFHPKMAALEKLIQLNGMIGFETLVSGLMEYGIILSKDAEGRWTVEDQSASANGPSSLAGSIEAFEEREIDLEQTPTKTPDKAGHQSHGE